METSIQLTLWLHLVSLALSGTATFGVPMVLGMMGRAEAAQKPTFAAVAAKLSSLGRMALVLMILSGFYLLWAKYGGFGGVNGWFHLKLTLVVLLAVLAVFNIFNARKARAGDGAAAARMPVLAKVGMGLVLTIVATAVLAFA